ncbi:uncharacterized protein Z518_09257 [Rhinocladiella mackenziei CBS 650.93]|uniref:Uncharacterized protein n=1 Tax=Rhinocladiella mackenziei CBS 650.93 TaxID=1442369 RepID=A0A0D2IE73_9EURO|nr:uncharacterized protein Z518_09257 [Rhinocladiella mackenziei CBS 650.93]KIX01531.1 hypothetical protein Z518_09257 [Rhinocladiella mackenziei CBS 650.93]
MASRRSSAISAKSVKQRKYSTDRHQRQAELSIRIEEGRSLRPPLVHEEDVSTSFVQDFFSKPESNTVVSLSHADAGPSPLDIHPGQRVRGFSEAFDELVASEESVDFKIPFPEPNAEQQLEIEQRAAVFRRTNTDIDAEQAHLRIAHSTSDARDRNGLVQRVQRLLGQQSVIKPGAFTGLRYAAGLATAHANAIISQKPAPLFTRRALYVLEYDTDESGVLLCAPPKLCGSVSSLRQHLEETEPKSLLRLIYVCNNEEAVNYLSNAFGVSGSSGETNERSFRDWIQDDRDIRRASLKAIRWRPAFDIARGVICSAFGFDFGSLVIPREKKHTKQQGPNHNRMTPNNTALFRQRIAVYMQRASSEALPGPRVTRFNSGFRHLHEMAKHDTIIVCEYSSGEVGEVVRASALLGLDPVDTVKDRSLASVFVLQGVMTHVFEGLYQIWREQIALIHEPHATLEDHIYSHPADASRARDVWALSQRLHGMLKLVNRHSKVIETVQEDFFTLAEWKEQGEWLGHVLDDFELLADNIRTDYLEPLEHMIDLVSNPFSTLLSNCCPA